MALDALVSIPVIIGLIGVVVAVLERGYKTYLEKKQADPKLKFDSAYLLNILISSGIMVAVITGVLPVVLAQIADQSQVPLTLSTAIVVFVLGYASTYRILDGLNNSTEKQKTIQDLQNEPQ